MSQPADHIQQSFNAIDDACASRCACSMALRAISVVFFGWERFDPIIIVCEWD